MAIRTRVKICGITRPQDGVQAAQLGVDAIGLVFYEKSPRNVSVKQAAEICESLPGFVTVVALFMDPDVSQVQRVLGDCPIDLIQFHGQEEPAFCGSFDKAYIKAMGMAGSNGHSNGQENKISDYAERYSSARSILLDSHAIGVAGGTGEVFNWQSIPEIHRAKIILAGGLKPDNVAQAIQQVRPYAVDLSSGVESAPGIKDIKLMTRLMNEVKRVDCESK